MKQISSIGNMNNTFAVSKLLADGKRNWKKQ